MSYRAWNLIFFSAIFQTSFQLRRKQDLLQRKQTLRFEVSFCKLNNFACLQIQSWHQQCWFWSHSHTQVRNEPSRLQIWTLETDQSNIKMKKLNLIYCAVDWTLDKACILRDINKEHAKYLEIRKQRLIWLDLTWKHVERHIICTGDWCRNVHFNQWKTGGKKAEQASSM